MMQSVRTRRSTVALVSLALAVAAFTGLSAASVYADTPSVSMDVSQLGVGPGMYLVGTDIAAGEYVLLAEGTAYCDFRVTSDASGDTDSWITGDSFFNRMIITVKNGQYLTVDKARIVPSSQVPPVDFSSGALRDGMYRVGYDIPPGQYTLLPDEGGGYYEKFSNSTQVGSSFLGNDFFTSPRYITLAAGQYLKLSWALMYPTPGQNGTPVPVYRFRNLRNGFYLWSMDPVEKYTIITTLQGVWLHEGPAYQINSAANTSPLWRFLNVRGGFYLYSADPNERDTIVRTLSNEWRLEGEAYKVSSDPAGSPVWRFRNRRDGTYLLSADPNEKDTIVRTLQGTWQLEGPAFYIAQ